MNPRTTHRNGITLGGRMDFARSQEVRALLRKPKRDSPGWSHALHDLWGAYVDLEDEYLTLRDSVSKAKEALG